MGSKGEDEQEGRGFKVEDRRRFVDTASAVADAPAASEHGQAPAEERAEPSQTERTTSAPSEHEAPLAEMTFSTFVMGLTTQALMHLGEIPDPVDNQVGCDLPAAKQMIDLLGILRDKTKGNLDASEEQLLGSMLYDLRMRYVEVARSQ